MADERELVSRLRVKDHEAFRLLYVNYSDALYGVVFRILKDEDESKDLLQEAFVKIWDKFETYDTQKGRLFTWMVNLTRNLAIDRIRSADYKNHELQNFVRDNSERAVDRKYSTGFSTDAVGLKGLILKLKHEHQILIQKIYFEGYTQADLAEEMDVPLGTLKTRLRAAIKALKVNFEDK